MIVVVCIAVTVLRSHRMIGDANVLLSTPWHVSHTHMSILYCPDQSM